MTALSDVQGIGPFLESQLREAGYTTVAGLAAADPDNLVAVRGIGSVSARQIIAAAGDLTPGTRSEPSGPKSTQDAEKELSGAKKTGTKKKTKKTKNAKAGKKSNKAKAKKKKTKNAKAGKKSNKAKAKKKGKKTKKT